MFKRYNPFKDKYHRAAWMRAYEAKLVAIVPAQAGRIDWDTATFLFNSGLPSDKAAERTAKRLTANQD